MKLGQMGHNYEMDVAARRLELPLRASKPGGRSPRGDFCLAPTLNSPLKPHLLSSNRGEVF